jgi:tetratricopeptide (TPR) repeat protein
MIDNIEQVPKNRDQNLILLHKMAGEAYFNLNNLTMALEEYKKVISLSPDDVMSHYRLGEIYDKKGMKEDAIREMEIASKMAPDDPRIFFQLGEDYFRKHNYEAALEKFEKAIGIDSSLNEANKYIAEIHFTNARFKDALTHYLAYVEEGEKTVAILLKIVFIFSLFYNLKCNFIPCI